MDGVQYLHYMSVREWIRPGVWRTNHAGIAVSRDGGRTWEKPRGARWPNRWGDNRFQLGAFAFADRRVYLLGTTNGRYGDAYLARADAAALPGTRAFEYWTGSGWSGFLRDELTTLPETEDRILATALSARWSYA